MSRHQRDRSKESIDEEIKKNLYELGLLGQNRGHSLASQTGLKHFSKQSGGMSRTHSEDSDRRPASVQAITGEKSFKNSSISSGTLPRPNLPRDQRTDPEKASVASKAKTVTFHRQYPQHRSKPMTTTETIVATERVRPRKDRTFVGGECAACEELLEHTLRGERVLQFACGHVAHEACFYEYIKDMDAQYCPTCDAPLGLDSNRGGSILDLSKLSNMVRSIAQQDAATTRSVAPTPVPWDKQTQNQDDTGYIEWQNRGGQRDSKRDSHDSQRMRIERLGLANNHSRNNSGNTSSADYPSQDQSGNVRKHDYDLHAMETTVVEPPHRDLRTHISPPVVTVRSEFPTLTRSQQQQSLTCLVTIEVPEAKWKTRRDESHADALSSYNAKNVHNHVVHSARQASHEGGNKQFVPPDSVEVREQATNNLKDRVENWHGLEFQRFGSLRLYGSVLVGKDQQSWQELDCYLFSEMLICVKEKKNGPRAAFRDGNRQQIRCTLKGSILIKKHLKQVQPRPDALILTLNLSVAELPTFHLQFQDRAQMELWQHALVDIHESRSGRSLHRPLEYDLDMSGTEDEEMHRADNSLPRGISAGSSMGGPQSTTTAPTEYSSNRVYTDRQLPPSLHVPLDIVVVIPISSSMQGLKIALLKDTLRFLISHLGDRDRMGLVTFGSSQGGVPLVGMTTKKWAGWNKVLNSIRPVGQKALRADVVDGANVAMDLLMQRKAANPISTILLISDSSTSDNESVSFVVQRAEAAKVGIYSFGLGLTHKPDSMIELSSRTKASYLYVKDWMLLRECVAGCLGSLQSLSHQNAKLRLKLPEGSPAKFVKISGALQTTKRATGRDAEAILGDLRFGDKRDILVQLVVETDTLGHDHLPQDHWESIVSSLEALGGLIESDEQRIQSIEEVPLLQADLAYSDLQDEGMISHLHRPSLLTITLLPSVPRSKQNGRPITPPIPPHPSIVQRRMELLTSDMLTRALTLVSRNQPDRAQHLLVETRTILKGLAKGGLPPLPNEAATSNKHSSTMSPSMKSGQSPRASTGDSNRPHSPASDISTPVPRTAFIDQHTMNALDADIEASLEWINHPAVFSRDSRKAVLQAIGVISSQRGLTFRTASESLWAERIGGIRRLIDASRDWRENSEDALTEEQ